MLDGILDRKSRHGQRAILFAVQHLEFMSFGIM
jgi:hypothetical protein